MNQHQHVVVSSGCSQSADTELRSYGQAGGLWAVKFVCKKLN